MQVVEQWAARFGLTGPKHLLQHYELPQDQSAADLLALPAPAAAPLPSQQQQQYPQLLPPQQQQQKQEEEISAALLPQQHGQQQFATASWEGGADGADDAFMGQPLDTDAPMQQQQQQDLNEEQWQQQLEQLEQQHMQLIAHPELQQGAPSREMQHVRLSELVMQASNRPIALFSHQGLCEHAVVISDVRLLHAADPSRRSAYPRTVFQALLGRRLHCGVCKRLGATALMLDHPETPEAVIVLCRLCCGLFSVEGYPGAKLVMLEPFPK